MVLAEANGYQPVLSVGQVGGGRPEDSKRVERDLKRLFSQLTPQYRVRRLEKREVLSARRILGMCISLNKTIGYLPALQLLTLQQLGLVHLSIDSFGGIEWKRLGGPQLSHRVGRIIDMPLMASTVEPDSFSLYL